MNLFQIISDTSPSGALRYALDLGHALERRGHSTATILRKGHTELELPFRKEGLAVGYLPLGGALDFISPTVFSRILDRVGPPIVIHTHRLRDALTALRARNLMKADTSCVKVVYSVREGVPSKKSRVERNTLRRLDAIIFPGEQSRRAFISALPAGFLKENQLHTVPELPDAPACPNRKEPVADAITHFVFAGCLTHEKGFDVLVEAIAIAETKRPGRARYTILGSGNSRVVMPVVRRARALDIDHKIEWKGQVDNIYPYLLEANAGIVPSRTPQASALTAIEFMSQGLPVVATREGGALEAFVRHGEDGLLVRPDSPEELAEALMQIIDNPAAARRMGAQAHTRVKECLPYSSFVDNILEIYTAPRQND